MREKKFHTISVIIAFLSLVVAIIAFFTPEVRRFFGFEHSDQIKPHLENSSSNTSDVQQIATTSTLSSEDYLKTVHYLYRQNDFDKAKFNCQRAIDSDNDNSEAYYLLGRIYFKQQRYNLAKTNYETAINKKHNYAEAHSRLGFTYIEIARNENDALKKEINYEKAEYHCKMAIDIEQTALYYYHLGCLYWDQKNWKIAVDSWEKSLSLEPTDKHYSKWFEEAVDKLPSEFEDNFNKEEESFCKASEGSKSKRYFSKTGFTISGKQDNYIAWEPTNFPTLTQAYDIQLHCKWQAGRSEKFFGLILFYDYDRDYFYYIGISKNGDAVLRRKKNGKWETIFEEISKFSDDSELTKISIQIRNHRLSYFVNYQRVGDAVIDHFKFKKFAVFVSGRQTVEFRSLKIFER